MFFQFFGLESLVKKNSAFFLELMIKIIKNN
jgi:hypothetical protein